jgi:cytochrome c peroxidase
MICPKFRLTTGSVEPNARDAANSCSAGRRREMPLKVRPMSPTRSKLSPVEDRDGCLIGRYLCAWCGLALLLLIGGAAAEAPVSLPPGSAAIAEQEPITAIPQPPAAMPSKLALGELLFEDTRLSHNGTRACSSCHDIHSNGADANQRDAALDGSQLAFNTPTVFNAALSFRFNWEGNFRTLETQAAASLDNPGIMATSIDEVISRLNADPPTVQRFKEAYGHGPDREGLLDAIATYERSLLTPASRFDRWLEGDREALSAEEQSGYQLFKSLGCSSCHQGVNVGGNLYERHGIFHPLASPKPEVLRVPSLRNVATTPPYFHDGSAPTLSDAVRRMASAQLDRTLPDQQIDAIVAFLGTLTGKYRAAPVSVAPR